MRPRVLSFAAGALAAALVLFSAPPAGAAEKYALAVFHFNIQYVAGGLVGFSFLPNPVLDLDADAVEDMIIEESFAPVIDLYEKHPSWGADIELQGYFLDVLAARHPVVLAKLRKLAKSGQIDVVSFHYSDQLFIAYPEEDWRRSQALTAATFAKHDVPLSRTVFCQEGQAGEGVAQRMQEVGYRNLVWPKNLWSYQHGDFDAAPLYSLGETYVVAGGKGVSHQSGSLDLSVTWSFLDDGELLATGDFDPYLADLFKHDAEAVAKYESELSDLEAQGYRIVTVDEYVDAVKDRVSLTPLPPLMDGTWQPNTTTAVFRWLGGKGIWNGEQDNVARSLGALAHRELVAAETVAKQSGVEARSELDSAWRLLFLSEVTDASGINPFRGEVEYGIAHATESLRIARSVIQRSKDALGAELVSIDPATGSVALSPAPELPSASVDAPIALSASAGDRIVTSAWELVGPGHHRVRIEIGAGSTTAVSVTFPGELVEELVTTRALVDSELVTYRRNEFTFESFHLALPTGLLSLTPSRYVIKDQARVHLAAKIRRDSGDVEFRDETLTSGEPATWEFHVLDGTAEEALELARQVNVVRRVVR